MKTTRYTLLLASIIAGPVLAMGATACSVPASEESELEAVGSDALAAGAAAWQHQALDFSCSTDVNNHFTKKSRRHYYSFPGTAGLSTHIELRGSWPAAWGAQIIVTDINGNVLNQFVASDVAYAELDVTFAVTGKHFVWVQPASIRALRKSYDYSLSAACNDTGCLSNQDCNADETCEIPVCKGGPCNFAGTCFPAPVCAEFETADGRFYAKNFPADQVADAKQWMVQDPDAIYSTYNFGSCADQGQYCTLQHDPVCGVPSSGLPTKYGNLCAFKVHVRSDAGAYGESKGKFTEGECSTYCGTVTLNAGTYYAKNFATTDEASSWIASFNGLDVASSNVGEGACNESLGCEKSYFPVCGVVRSEPAQTYGNQCQFEAAVRGDAGADVGSESKGYATVGECGAQCNYSDPDKSYVATSVDQCSVIRYVCAQGYEAFSDDCGCGCQPSACQYNDPTKTYASTSPETCMVIRLGCPTDSQPFSDQCGCGCQTVCDYSDPSKNYVATSPARCQAVKFACDASHQAFFNECGCGCEAL